ncbi:extracellular solute-binding protein [Varunaivibrio sulfuroxidans]|uniref:Iron(III) transport system substrate-binding protein n=1 Tax=Varunaivibrio sulfuroxidans TaxID=1773489 RepID=A0A4R3JEA3_9PROT|nr:extracellular solute-binding protein [Varunaivibrio sulfuroxidans]TCS63010.1 iron(III) transport system substrate-binding protein [Varunaivibrio sulfuroxidans]WES31913.1 extracellular solute-binding protein [Varunaivibrio sulfuroxidans]
MIALRSLRRALAGCAFIASASTLQGLALANEPIVNLYSYRQPFLMQPLLDAFSAQTGIKVNVAYAKKGLVQRLKAEGVNSPADVVLSADITRAQEIKDAGLARAIPENVITANIPAAYRDPEGYWVGLTSRARVIYASKTRVKPGEIRTYEDLATARFKGRVCTRSGKHEYNVSLLASIISAVGEEKALRWLKGLKANLARRPQGNDRAQVRAIKEGECDVAIGNSYYFGKMATNEKHPEQKQWAEAVHIVFPNQPQAGTPENSPLGRGAHINISAAILTKSSKNRENALRLISFLSDSQAQRIYAAQNFEYPLKPGVALDPLVASWGRFKADTANLTNIVRYRDRATRMMDLVDFDH